MKQKQNIRRLNAISKMVDLEQFYCITMNGSISLQAGYKPAIVVWATTHNFKLSYLSNGYITLSRSNIEIVLT
jgi:hypothetical protein